MARQIISNLFFCCLLTLVTGQDTIYAQDAPPYKHYRFSEFQPGTVMLNDGSPTETTLNYNLVTQQIILDLGHTKIPYTQTEMVRYIKIGSIIMIPHEDCFLELLEDGHVSLLVRHSQKVTQTGQNTGYGTASQTSTSITPGGLHQTDYIYQHNLPSDYTTQEESRFYLRHNGVLHEVKNLKKACGFIPELEDKLIAFTKSQKIKVEKQGDMLRWIRYCNANLP